MNVKLIRMSSGEDVIANVVDENIHHITIKDAIYPVPTQSGNIGFSPWSPLVSPSSPEITISRSFIVYIAEVNDAVKDSYQEHYGQIVLTEASKKKLIL